MTLSKLLERGWRNLSSFSIKKKMGYHKILIIKSVHKKKGGIKMDILKLIQKSRDYQLDDTLLLKCIENPIETLKEITNDEQRFSIFFGILKRLWDLLFIQSKMLSVDTPHVSIELRLTQALQITTPRYFSTINFIMDMAKIKPKDIKNIEFDRDTFLVLFTLYDYYKLMMSQKDTQKALINKYYDIVSEDIKGSYMRPILVEVTQNINSHQNNISDCLLELKNSIRMIKGNKVQATLYGFITRLINYTKADSETAYAKIIKATKEV